jgi:hypothetical protein
VRACGHHDAFEAVWSILNHVHLMAGGQNGCHQKAGTPAANADVGRRHAD